MRAVCLLLTALLTDMKFDIVLVLISTATLYSVLKRLGN